MVSFLRRANHALWVAVALPLVAVIASFATFGIALLNPEHELPGEYHWEGARLDRDFARAARAAALTVRIELDASAADGACRARLRMRGELPQRLDLHLTHATLPALDRRIALQRTAPALDDAADFVAPCRPLPAGHWRIELGDAAGEWQLRRSARGTLAGLTLEGIAS